MESRLVALLQRLNGWRLWLLFSLATVVAALIIVSLMDLALMGRITTDYLVTGLVTAGVVAPVSIYLLSSLLRQIAQQQQLALKLSVESAEARLRVALDSTDEGILMVAADGRVLSANKRFFELWQVPAELAASGNDDRLIEHVLDQLEDPQAFLAGVQRLYGSDAQAHDTLLFKDGRTFERFTRALAFGGERGRIWCFRDVSLQARTRETLAEREEQYRAIVNQAGDGIDLVDVESRSLLEANAAACRMLGYRRDELIGQPLTLVHGDLDDAAWSDIVTRVEREGEASFETRLRRKDGQHIDIFTRMRAIRLRGRTCLVTVWRDIGDRKAAEQALEQSRRLLQTIIDATPLRVFWKDKDLRYLGCNPAFARDAGVGSPADLLGKDDHQLVWAGQAALYQADDRAVMASGVPKLFYEEPQTGPDGQTIWLSTSKVPLTSADGTIFGVLGIYEDITGRRQLVDKIRQREQYLRALLDNFPFMVWLKDEQSRFLAVNQVFAKTFGCPSTEWLVGKSDLDIAPADLAERYRADDQAVLQGGRSKHLEELVETDGRRIWFETYKSPVSIEGRVVGTVGFGRDITERKLEEAELERHRQHLEELVQQRTSELLATEARATRILDSAADGLFGLDRDGRITFINRAACRMLGHEADLVTGQPAHDLFHRSRTAPRPDPRPECPVCHAWRGGRASRFDNETYWHADGHPVPVALASHPIVEKGELVGAVVSVVDVSAQREAMQARERALVAAENLARARSEFLANMSHEIRTPMNGVLGFAQIGQRHHRDPERARDAFEKILASGQRLLGVVNDILDFSKIDAGELHIEDTELDLGEVLDDSLQLVADRARAKGLELRLDKAADLPPRCVGDPLRLGQVLLNLLTNAIKFTDAGSVALSAARDGGQLVFCVTDTGIGISAEQLGYIFNPFQQADGSTTRKFGGTGLGLAICKRLVGLMQGRIEVDSTPGRGSRFELRLPYVPPASSAGPLRAAGSALPDQPLAGLSILLVEDDEINRVMLEANLIEDGATLVMVPDGTTAVARVVADGPTAYDVVLMDIQMPGMDGYEAARQILQRAPGLPIIGQTAHAFHEDRDRCLAAGMVAHIAKPIDPRALTQLVLKVLADRR